MLARFFFIFVVYRCHFQSVEYYSIVLSTLFGDNPDMSTTLSSNLLNSKDNSTIFHGLVVQRRTECTIPYMSGNPSYPAGNVYSPSTQNQTGAREESASFN